MANERMEKPTRATSSIVGSLIKFDLVEHPEWRKKDETIPPVSEMILDIVHFQEEWNSMKENQNSQKVETTKKSFLNSFVYHCGLEEELGCGTFEEVEKCLEEERDAVMTREKQETINLKHAYKCLLSFKKEEKNAKNHGLVVDSMLQEAHKKVLKGIHVKSGCTEAGKYSNNPRVTSFMGEDYKYPVFEHFEEMHQAVITIIDRFNDLYMHTQPLEDESHECKVKKLGDLFKACGYFVFEMLDLHPFGDGNGRLCRLLCSYVLSTCTPFPTPIYNIWSSSSKHDYKKALVETRKSKTRHPRSLTSMIIESNWYCWKEFLKKIKSSKVVVHVLALALAIVLMTLYNMYIYS